MRSKITGRLAVFLAAAITAASAFGASPAYGAEFSDVPPGDPAYESVSQMVALGITEGVGGGRFGIGDPVTRAQFASFLCRLYGWETDGAGGTGFSDVAPGMWYFPSVAAAAQNGAFIETSGQFRPDAPITRGEMAVMLVRSLGFGGLAEQITSSGFSDVTENPGYIALARDFGIIYGTGGSSFSPDATATRGQAAMMMMRMRSRSGAETGFLNGFYAIRSAGQMGRIPSLDSVCFGWGRLEAGAGGVTLNMSSSGGNEYSVPDGYEQPLGMAKSALLMVAVKEEAVNGERLADHIVSDAGARDAAIDAIASALDGYPQFSGAAIDFEGMKGEQSREGFTAFLTGLRSRLGGRLMYVAVHPRPKEGLEYFDAYDYSAIGNIADKVILMAHDYHAKSMTEEEMAMNFTTTPLAPIDQVYYSLKAITDEMSGVKDRGKIALQFSFDTVQWQSKDGRVTNSRAYTPTYEQLVARMRSEGASANYSARYESPYVTYTAEDGTQNIIWYENSRGVGAKMRLAKMFGINGFSLWRLGIVPEYSEDTGLDVWGEVGVGR